ncbi:MAG: type I pullulanase, partial [Verrucomicrobiota bacterium]
MNRTATFAQFGKPVLLAVALLTGCERAVEQRPVVPAAPSMMPPPQATGYEIATVRVRPPPNTGGLNLFAGLKRDGRIVARGAAALTATGVTEFVVRALDKTIQLKSGPYELSLVIDRDGTLECNPSYGDLFLQDTWEWPKVAKVVAYEDPSRWQLKRLENAAKLITVHYRRHDEDYADAGIWSWDVKEEKSPAQNELQPVGRDDFGLIFQLYRGDYGATGNAEKIGLVPRLHADWNQKDAPDKFWTPALGNEVYLIGGDANIYMKKPAIAKQVIAAFVDTRDQLVVQVSEPIPAPPPVTVTDQAGKNLVVTSVHKEKANAIAVTLAAPLDIAGTSYTVSVAGFAGSVPVTPRRILDDPDLFCDRQAVLGATYTREATTFRVFAPTARAVSVVLYDAATGAAGRRLIGMVAAGKGIWESRVAGDLAGKFYAYSLTGDGFAPDRDVTDIYAVNAVDNSRRARITDMAATNPPGWEGEAPAEPRAEKTARREARPPGGKYGPVVAAPQDMVVYEMHVRDFTIAPNSPAKPEHRGKYLGFIAGIEHLKELGVTHVQLLPIQEFENDDFGTNYNWGYITTLFNSPEGWFASNPNDDSRIRELKQMITALHEAGLGVILDVVYNHTSNNAPFNSLVPRYYYRFDAYGGYLNGSGCGNDFRTEAPMARKYLIDSLKFWVTEYGIDGFRFDLMALLDLESMKEAERELRALRPDVILYGEPWAAGPSTAKIPTNKQTIGGTRIGAFNDAMRNALVGSPFDKAHPAFVQSGNDRDALQRAIQGQWRDWSDGPHQVIQFMSCHDNYVIYDKLQASKPGASHADIIEMMKLGYLALFTAQGIPFIHGGEEFARTKKGHENSYNAPDDVNEVDWSLKQQNRGLFDYVRDLIALRKAHPV